LSFSLIIGLLFIRRPGEGAVTLTLLLIVFFVVEGFSKVIFHTIRPFANWGWVLANGVVGILLSFYLWPTFSNGDLAAWRVARDPAHQ
jgi:uncharacterized membrane protein HdeD (DUF308 family)